MDASPTPESFRSYLRTLTLLMVSDPLLNRLDLSGVVQQTLLEAEQVASEWPVWSIQKQSAWLRTTLIHNLTDLIRSSTAERRDVTREHSLEALIDQSASRMDRLLAANHTSPGGQAERNDQLLRLSIALAVLPDDQREAIEIHHLAGLSLEQTAAQMGKTVQSVVGLLYRGLKQLKEQLKP